MHVQFETIHPYLDGNGRIGRLLVALLLDHWRLLSKPLLYLSLFFKRRREDYYERLSRVRTDGDWEGWTAFFLEGVATTPRRRCRDARSLFALVERDRRRLLGSAGVSVSTLRLFEELPRHPVVTLASVVKLLETTKPTAASAIAGLERAGSFRRPRAASATASSPTRPISRDSGAGRTSPRETRGPHPPDGAG